MKAWLERAAQSERNLKEKINVLRGSLLLWHILFQQQINLPPDILTKNLPNKIANLRLEQFDINQQRDMLYQFNDHMENLEKQLIEKSGGEQKSNHLFLTEDKTALAELLDIRRKLLDELNLRLGNQISQAINLQLDQNQLLSVVRSHENTLAQQIFLVNSNKPIDIAWVEAFPEAAKQQISQLDFHLSKGSLKKGVANSFIVVAPLLVFAFSFIWLYRKISARLQKIDQSLSSLS